MGMTLPFTFRGASTVSLRARSSAVEHPVYIGEAAGSIPAAPSHFKAPLDLQRSGGAFVIFPSPAQSRAGILVRTNLLNTFRYPLSGDEGRAGMICR